MGLKKDPQIILELPLQDVQQDIPLGYNGLSKNMSGVSVEERLDMQYPVK